MKRPTSTDIAEMEAFKTDKDFKVEKYSIIYRILKTLAILSFILGMALLLFIESRL